MAPPLTSLSSMLIACVRLRCPLARYPFLRAQGVQWLASLPIAPMAWEQRPSSICLMVLRSLVIYSSL